MPPKRTFQVLGRRRSNNCLADTSRGDDGSERRTSIKFASPCQRVEVTVVRTMALGLVLFVVTLFLNVIALYIVRKYREQYE